jgi:hypothetical protein
MLETTLQNIADAINNLADAIRTKNQTVQLTSAPIVLTPEMVKATATEPKVKKAKPEAPAATTEVPTPPAAPKEAAKVEAPAATVTIEQLMALGHKLVAASKQDILKAINAKHGDAKLSTTPPEKFAAKYADLLEATKGL